MGGGVWRTRHEAAVAKRQASRVQRIKPPTRTVKHQASSSNKRQALNTRHQGVVSRKGMPCWVRESNIDATFGLSLGSSRVGWGRKLPRASYIFVHCTFSLPLFSPETCHNPAQIALLVASQRFPSASDIDCGEGRFDGLTYSMSERTLAPGWC